MQYPKIPLAQSILTIFKKKNIQHIVISPGSRNAPLTIGFASDPYFKCYSVADERSAAFFGLGLAQQLKSPVALVCTSGSALLNYYPAVAEAFYSQIPLIILSADRPLNKIDIGDGQTIRQQNVFNNHILYNGNLTEEACVANDVIINEAINLAITKKGPTHLNAPFEEPLYEVVAKLSVNPEIFHPTTTEEVFLFDENLKLQWQNASKKIVLIGVLDPDVLSQKVIESLANDPSVIVLTEVTSNVRNEKFINSIDSLITTFTEEQFKMLQPDILVSIGGMVVSKRIKAFFRKYKPKQHWHIDTLRAYDTFGVLTKHIKANPDLALNDILQEEVPSNYQADILNIYNKKRKDQEVFVNQVTYSDLKVFESIFKNMPQNTLLHISNSSAIRYAQLFNLPQSVEVFCNRGTSGIDGSTSTAIGASVQSSKNTVLITGDISFLYDSNALWNNYTPSNFKIIILNNRGGGIFRILPGHQDTQVFNTYFETEHNYTAEHLAKMYGYEYQTCEKESELNKLQAFFESDTKTILEIFTPTKLNNKVLTDYFKFSR